MAGFFNQEPRPSSEFYAAINFGKVDGAGKQEKIRLLRFHKN